MKKATLYHTKYLIIAMIFFSSVFSHSAKAETLMGLGAGFLQASHSLENQSDITNTIYNASVYASMNKGDTRFYIGAEYASTAISQYLDDTTKATVTSSDWFVSIKYGFVQKQLMALTFGFSPYTQATYKVTGSSAETWLGTSYMGKFSLQPDLDFNGKKLRVAASIVYYYAGYTSRSGSAASVSGKESFTRSMTLPMIEIVYRF